MLWQVKQHADLRASCRLFPPGCSPYPHTCRLRASRSPVRDSVTHRFCLHTCRFEEGTVRALVESPVAGFTGPAAPTLTCNSAARQAGRGVLLLCSSANNTHLVAQRQALGVIADQHHLQWEGCGEQGSGRSNACSHLQPRVFVTR